MTEERLYALNEKEKNDAYLERCLQSEKAGFVPLVYSTTGGTGPACEAFHKRLVLLLASKRRDSYASVLNNIRTKVRFTLLKSIASEESERSQQNTGLHQQVCCPLS